MRNTTEEVIKHPFGFLGGSVVKNQPDNAGVTEDAGLIPGLEKSPGRGNGYPLQNSCLDNSMDRGALWAPWGPWGHKEAGMTEVT